MLTEDRRKGQTRNDLVDDAFKRYLLPSTKAAADFRAAQVRMHTGKRIMCVIGCICRCFTSGNFICAAS